tara:strand:+ start:64 stop:654 length:591 start_codon:yes stop_codon:yes gene_type:complete
MIENRKEYKFVLNSNETKNFLTIFGDKLNILHPNRTITSLYFDTVDFQLYKNSKLYDTNKMKVRIRTYSNEEKFYKEIKFNDGIGKRKIVTNINITSFDDIKELHEDKLILIPAVYTSYNREYYTFDDLRITVDSKISFSSHKIRSLSNSKTEFSKSIVEYKFGKNINEIEKYFFLNPVAFSKYQTAISKIYNLDY